MTKGVGSLSGRCYDNTRGIPTATRDRVTTGTRCYHDNTSQDPDISYPNLHSPRASLKVAKHTREFIL